MKPSVGRIVHYVSWGTPGGEYKSECWAAVITEVGGEPDDGGFLADGMTAGLCVLTSTGQFFSRDIPCDLGPDEGIGTNLCDGKLYRGGTWHWPVRVT